MAGVIAAGRVAVVTGGAKGIGFAAAKYFAKAGMKVAIADTDAEALQKASAELKALPGAGDVITSVTNVASFDEVQKLQKEVVDKFGEVAILMNNAGISPPTSSWGNYENWRKLLDVNMYGVIHGQHAFLPGMIAQGKPAAVINVGSKQGITNPPGNPAYSASKSAVKIITEQLAHELRNTPGAQVTAHLLVPGYTFTSLTARSGQVEKPPGAWTPDQVAEHLVNGILKGDFYIICPDNEATWELDQKRIQWAADDLIKSRPALSRWHPEFSGEFQEFLKNTVPLFQLPNSTLLLALSFLSIKDLCCLREVCKFLHQLIFKDIALWKALIVRDFGKLDDPTESTTGIISHIHAAVSRDGGLSGGCPNIFE